MEWKFPLRSSWHAVISFDSIAQRSFWDFKIRPVLEFLVAISSSKLDMLFIADSVSSGTVRFSPFTTYKGDRYLCKKYNFVIFYLHSEIEIWQHLRLARVLGQEGLYHCAHFCKPVNFSLSLLLCVSPTLSNVDVYSKYMYPLHCTMFRPFSCFWSLRYFKSQYFQFK